MPGRGHRGFPSSLGTWDSGERGRAATEGGARVPPRLLASSPKLGSGGHSCTSTLRQGGPAGGPCAHRLPLRDSRWGSYPPTPAPRGPEQPV